MMYRKLIKLIYMLFPVCMIALLLNLGLVASGIMISLNVTYGILICLVILALIAIFIVIVTHKNKYVEGGILDNWSLQTQKLMGTQFMVETFDRLDLYESDFTIVNGSANIGQYDYELAMEFERRRCSSEFYIFDKFLIKEHVDSFEGNHVQFTYTEEKDAAEMLENLRSFNVEQVHVIWDIKGYLWHEKENSIQALNSLHNVLVPGGYLLIDAMDTKPFKSSLNKVFEHLFGYYRDFGEVSTYKKLQKYVLSDEELKKKFKTLFNVDVISLNSGKNVKIACLKKR